MQETRTFGDNLREQMNKRGMKIMELSRKSKYSRLSISGWLSGKNMPSLLAAVRIAKILHCKVEDLTKDIGYKDARRTEDGED